MAKEQYPKKGFREVAFSGKLRTADPGTNLSANDFQVLKNLRYNRGSLRSVSGQTKINTTATASTALKSGVHFKKDFPSSESHVIVATTSAVYDNTTAIPGQGSFSSVFTPTGSGNPRFTVGPNGSVVMCNGTDTAIWYGNETPVGAFLDWDSVGDTYKYDWLEQISNTLTTDYATLHRYADTVDSDTVLLLHMDDDGDAHAQEFEDDSDDPVVRSYVWVGDDITGGYVATGMTVNGHVNTNTSIKKFGTASAYFDGANDDIEIDDHADFDFSATGSDGAFTIDCWIYYGSGDTQPPQGTIFYQQTDASNYVKLYTSGNFLKFDVYAAGSPETTLTAAVNRVSYPSPPAAWCHVAVVGEKSGSNYLFRLFFNGSEFDYENNSTTNHLANYTGNVFIGAATTGNDEFTGYIDEFRVSKVSRWTSGFSPPTKAYGSGNITAMYIATPLPAKGFKFYVGTANTTAGTAIVSYWNGSSWIGFSPSGVGSVPLDATESWTFTDTASLAKQRNIDDIVAYWYKVEITECDTTTTLYQVTANCGMQQLKDLWDGVYRPVDVFLVYDDSNKVYNNLSANVFEDAIDTQNIGTYANLSGLMFADDKVYVGSIEQLQGFNVGIQGGFENTNECTLTVEYWNGSGWINLNVIDGTRNANISFAKSGTIHWVPPSKSSEFRTSISGISGKTNVLENFEGIRPTPRNEIALTEKMNALNGVGKKSLTPVLPISLYYYRLSWTGNGSTTAFPANAGTTPNFTAGMHVFNVKTIPAPTDCRGYKFALMHDDSLFLCNNEDSEPNAVIYSAFHRPQVFNGEESGKLYFGDSTGIVAACSFSNQFGSSIQKTALFAKDAETWKVVGEWPYQVHEVSMTDGCVAPESMSVGEVEIAQGLRRKVAVWVAQRGVVYSDGNFVKELSEDIRDLFSPKHSNYLGASTIATIHGRIDPVFNEYRMVVPGSQEWCYDFTEGKWYRVDRGSLAYLNGCFPVYDTNGTSYMYGFTPQGFVMRLDNGTTFASSTGTNNITSTVRLADIALHESSIMFKSRINWATLVTKAKSTTSSTISTTLYVDGKTTGTSQSTVDPTKSGYSYTQGDIFGEVTDGVFHSPEFSITTSDESVGFEPILWGCNFTTYLREK